MIYAKVLSFIFRGPKLTDVGSSLRLFKKNDLLEIMHLSSTANHKADIFSNQCIKVFFPTFTQPTASARLACFIKCNASKIKLETEFEIK